VPSRDRVGLDNNGSFQQRQQKAIEPDKEQSVRWCELWLGGKPAPQQVQLMAQEDNLGLSRACDLNGEADFDTLTLGRRSLCPMWWLNALHHT
jgi:hypothetical protein